MMCVVFRKTGKIGLDDILACFTNSRSAGNPLVCIEIFYFIKKSQTESITVFRDTYGTKNLSIMSELWLLILKTVTKEKVFRFSNDKSYLHFMTNISFSELLLQVMGISRSILISFDAKF